MNLIVVSNYHTLTAFGRTLRTSCIIADRARNGMTVVYSENEDGSKGRPYQPMQFPKGTWPVLAVEPTTAPLLAPVFIKTGAHQTVHTWTIDERGKYVHENPDTVEDWGYLLHHDAIYQQTDGCIRLDSPEDALWLAGEIKPLLDRGESVQIMVV